MATISLIYRIGGAWPWSMGKGMENALKELGHEVNVFVSEKNSGYQVAQYDNLYEFLQKPCDMLIAMGGGDKYCAFHYNEKIRKHVKNMKVPRLAYFMEGMKTRTITRMRYEKTIPLWTHILTCDETDVEEIRSLGCEKVGYAPGWVDETLFKPTRMPYKHEFQFIGYIHPHRILYVEHFKKHLAMIAGRYATIEEYIQGINETKILIGIPTIMKGYPQRVAETLACGKVLIHKRPAEDFKLSRQLFEDKKHIVLYDTMEEAVELAKYYSEHDDEREKIEENARKEICEKHTILRRAQEFINFALYA